MQLRGASLPRTSARPLGAPFPGPLPGWGRAGLRVARMPRARPVLQQTQDDREARTEQKEDSEASVPPIGFDEDGKLLLFGI